MYTVNIYYCYYILHHLCIIPVIPHPFFPISATFLQFIPASFLPFPALFLPVPALLFPLLDHSFSFLLFLPVLAPFPFIQVLLLFSKFDLLPFYLFLPRLSVACPFFPVHISQLFSLSLFICPIWSTFIYFPVSSLICPAHVLSFMQVMPPFLCSYLLCPLPIRITPFSQFLFPNSLVLPSSSSVCSVSSFFVLNVTMLFCLLGWNRLLAVGLFS